MYNVEVCELCCGIHLNLRLVFSLCIGVGMWNGEWLGDATETADVESGSVHYLVKNFITLPHALNPKPPSPNP